jgi:hypothetical protein
MPGAMQTRLHGTEFRGGIAVARASQFVRQVSIQHKKLWLTPQIERKKPQPIELKPPELT